MSTALLQDPTETTEEHQTNKTLQLVSFHLAGEEYGIEITKVREIILATEITKVPQTPNFIKGLINLRSMVIPIVDLRTRFDLPEGEENSETRIMVVNVADKTVGVIVDAVSEVLTVPVSQIAPPPPTVACLGREYLTGLVKLEDRMLILLDVDLILDEEATAAINGAVDG